jgi:hypothetical protein
MAGAGGRVILKDEIDIIRRQVMLFKHAQHCRPEWDPI